ncbi:hypothetical protein K2173_006223 [Erythroxylum novogranatense]|uniref:Uncharacterized protein n=1 Tax=Erythroxylum novogranatense TaxID=1862640 RepID=A0AAV8TE35_9ROSI|nr:hypothetical protein K2173_006223 [Erythroxylum novogranatense]
MKQTKLESNDSSTKTKRPVPPPPPLPLPRFWVRKNVTQSVTNQEIAKFWRQKCIEEEDHLLAAIKAAARIRARKLTEDEYMQFEESLKNDEGGIKESNSTAIINKSELNNKDEVRVGIKDWWTKSKYAYLNQPAVGSMEPPKRRASNYIPNCITFKPSPYILHV